MNDSNEIIVDLKTIKALAVNTRLKILEELSIKPRTLSDLASLIHLSNATIKEHLDAMIEADLVTKQSETHKFKYYSVTAKGSRIVNPYGTRVRFVLFALLFTVIILSLIFVRIFFTTLFYYNSLSDYSVSLQNRVAMPSSENVPETPGAMQNNMIKATHIFPDNTTLRSNAKRTYNATIPKPVVNETKENLSNISENPNQIENYKNQFYRNVTAMFGITIIFIFMIFLFGFFLGRSKKTNRQF